MVEANSLLVCLNNAAGNVAAGDASTNRSIGAPFDPATTATPEGKHAIMPPLTEQSFGAWGDDAPSPDSSPGGSVRSSHHHSTKGKAKLTIL